MKNKRQPWDEYFLDIADKVSTRATCPRASVGAVIVDDMHRIRSTGYNGAAAELPHCTDVGCDIVDGHCLRSIHAEQNALDLLPPGGSREGWTCYTTITPCPFCREGAEKQGIQRFIWRKDYP